MPSPATLPRRSPATGGGTKCSIVFLGRGTTNEVVARSHAGGDAVCGTVRGAERRGAPCVRAAARRRARQRDAKDHETAASARARRRLRSCRCRGQQAWRDATASVLTPAALLEQLRRGSQGESRVVPPRWRPRSCLNHAPRWEWPPLPGVLRRRALPPCRAEVVPRPPLRGLRASL